MDIINSSYYQATGDILNTTYCSNKMPFENRQLADIRQRVSLAEQKLAQAKSIEKQADINLTKCQHARLGLFCKKKYGGSRSELSRKLADAHVQVNAANQALTAAKAELQRAEQANKQAQTAYEKCKADELERLRIEEEKHQAELERQKQLDALKAQQQIKHEEEITEQKKVGVQRLEASKDYAIYGAIALGVVGMAFFGYKIATS